MMITRKAMARRTMLRGMGTVMALPLLDAMVPSATALEQGAAARKRLQVIYTPNGMMMQNWTPATPALLSSVVTSSESEQITAHFPASASPYFVRIRAMRTSR